MDECEYFIYFKKFITKNKETEKLNRANFNENSHDFLSALRVRFLSRGVVLGVDVAVLTNDSNNSSSPSVKLSSVIFTAGDRGIISARRRLNTYWHGLSILSTDGL